MSQTPDEYIPDPRSETEALIQAFLHVIEQHLATTPQAQHILRAIQEQQASLEATHHTWLVDEQSSYHLKTGAVALAAYRVLQHSMPQADLLALLHTAFTAPLRDAIQSATAHMLDHAPDPFAVMVATSRAREIHFFGTGFIFEHPRDDDRAYYADVTHCLWHSFFVANGAPELTPIFCDFDASWIGAIDPTRHRFRFGRATTLGYGGQLCAFHFFRLQSQEPQP